MSKLVRKAVTRCAGSPREQVICERFATHADPLFHHQVPTSVFPRPKSKNIPAARSQLEFKYKTTPFSFQVIRKSDKEVLFDTTNQPIVFEEQYLRIATSLPANANLYGLGEHTSSFRLPTQNYTRTLWNRDSYAYVCRPLVHRRL